MRFVDSHCHFDLPVFDQDREAVVAAMHQAGVSDVILPAISAVQWPRLREIAHSVPGLHASYGLHPMFMAQHTAEHVHQLRQWLSTERPVAIGECGLDFFVEPAAQVTQSAQTELLLAHLRLALEFDLPLIIHARKATDILLKYLRQFSGLRGVVHSFAGSQQQADQLIERGFYLGIGGTVTYERAQRLRRIVATVPAERLLLETDAPDQPDSQWRGRRNEPARLPVIAAHLAALRGVSVAEIARITTANAQVLFGLNT